MNKFTTILMALAVALVGAGLGSLISGILIKLLWNGLMPSIFALGEITYWQGVGISILAYLLIRPDQAKSDK